MNFNSFPQKNSGQDRKKTTWENTPAVERAEIDEIASQILDEVEDEFSKLGGEKMTTDERLKNFIPIAAKLIKRVPEKIRHIVLGRVLTLHGEGIKGARARELIGSNGQASNRPPVILRSKQPKMTPGNMVIGKDQAGNQGQPQ